MVEPPKRNYNSLQLLRGVAAVLVVFYHGIHTQVLNIFKFGYMGVDLFFVLSGFIILYIHFSDFGLKNKLKPYLIKRFIRIYPLYVVVTLLYILLLMFFGRSLPLDYVIKSLLLIPQQVDPVVGVAWTLQHEFLFYLIFSLFIWNKKLFYPLLALWGSAIIAFFIFTDIASHHPIVRIIFSPINIEFLFGCIVALLVIKNKWSRFIRPASYGIIAILSAITLQLLGIISLHRVIAWGIPSAFIIWGLVRLENRKGANIPKILMILGDASYSIYLTHLLTLLVLESIIKRIEMLANMNTNVAEIGASLITIAAGCVFYIVIEKPLLDYLKNRFFVIKKEKKVTKAIVTQQ